MALGVVYGLNIENKVCDITTAMEQVMEYRGLPHRLHVDNGIITVLFHEDVVFKPLFVKHPDRTILIDSLNGLTNVTSENKLEVPQVIDLLNDPRLSAEVLVIQVMKKSLMIQRGSLYMRGAFYVPLPDGIVFATDLKALRYVFEPDRISRLETGRRLRWTKEGVTEEQYHPLIRPSIRPNLQEFLLIKTLKQAITRSFSRIGGANVGVLFSGGVDSGLVAYLAKRECSNTILYSVSALESRDTVQSRIAADLLGIKLVRMILDEDSVWQLLPEVIFAIEDSNRLNVSISLPFLVASRLARRDGISLLLSGQGPDELFAGYARHVRILKTQGPIALANELWNEVSITHRTNLERDEKAVAYGGCEIMFPYLSSDFVTTALGVDISWKIQLSDPPIRKYIFRRLAEDFGLPKEIASAPKNATQFSSKSDRLIAGAVYRFIGKPNGLSRRESNRIVQMTLDMIASELGLYGTLSSNYTELDTSFDWSNLTNLIRRFTIPRLSEEEQ